MLFLALISALTISQTTEAQETQASTPPSSATADSVATEPTPTPTPSAPAVTKDDLKGFWRLKEFRCSKGEKAKNGAASGSLVYTSGRLKIELADRKGRIERVADTKDFVIQENLLTLPNKSGTASFQVELKDKRTLLLKFPVTGITGDCPTSEELLVGTFVK